MKAVLITRPEPDGARLAGILRKMGFRAIVCPMLKIVPAPDLKLPGGVQGLILTSANGARALALRGAVAPELAVFALGEKTARAARAAGFADVRAGDGRRASLVRRIRALAGDPGRARLVHVCGAHVAGDWRAELAGQGIEILRLEAYRAQAVEGLSPAARRALAADEVGAALFFSPRSAELFCRAARRAGLAGRLGGVRALCLSESIRPPGFAGRLVARAPSCAALIELLEGDQTGIKSGRKPRP